MHAVPLYEVFRGKAGRQSNLSQPLITTGVTASVPATFVLGKEPSTEM